MPYSLAEVLAITEQLWPIAGASEWDAPGLVSGDHEQRIRRVHLAVDAVAETVEEAVGMDADLLLAHHPLLMRGVTSVAEDRYKGALVSRLIRANCALLTAHTNADVVADGVSDVIASKLGLVDSRPIQAQANPEVGIGRVGRLAQSTTLGALAQKLAQLLPHTAPGVRVAGEFDAPVNIVSLCGGAGDSLLSEPDVLASDVYITSDLRHHPASESREQARLGRGAPALIDVSHWASEWLWLETAAQQLRAELPDVNVTISEIRTDPWDFVVVQ